MRKVLDKGYVALAGFNASDLDVVNAARVSFNQSSQDLEPGDERLIGYLMRNRHGSPFEHNYFRWEIKAPLFVFREWHRHRVGWAYNEWSGRYSKLEAEYYIPARDDIRTQVGKPGNYTFERIDDDSEAHGIQEIIEAQAISSFYAYDSLLDRGVAKEVARLVLPVNTYSKMHASCNARSLMHFLSLRNSEHAQREIREYAKRLEEDFALLMPVTWEAFVNNGRMSP